MFGFKKKSKILTLPALQARVIAQLQANKIKFDNEQYILKKILEQAKRGAFEIKAYDKHYYSLLQFVGHALTDDDMKFLKDLGYIIEVEEKLWKVPGYAVMQPDGTIEPVKDKAYPYNEYTIKW
jgi:hypothetical protein